jgi:hypothetical protein
MAIPQPRVQPGGAALGSPACFNRAQLAKRFSTGLAGSGTPSICVRSVSIDT